MRNRRYVLDACSESIALYTASKNGKKVDAEKYRVQGLYAGELLGIITNEQGKALIADLHVQVFGETIDERATRNVNNALKNLILMHILRFPPLKDVNLG